MMQYTSAAENIRALITKKNEFVQNNTNEYKKRKRSSKKTTQNSEAIAQQELTKGRYVYKYNPEKLNCTMNSRLEIFELFIHPEISGIKNMYQTITCYDTSLDEFPRESVCSFNV